MAVGNDIFLGHCFNVTCNAATEENRAAIERLDVAQSNDMMSEMLV